MSPRRASAAQSYSLTGSPFVRTSIKSLLTGRVLERGDPRAIDIWRKLQTSDHFYYMHTNWYLEPQGQISPFANPHDAYIYYMNVLRDFSEALGAGSGGTREFVTYPETLRVKTVVNQ